MKLDCLDHPKLFEFASLLQVEELMAVGVLESIFCVTARYAKRGDLGHLSNKAIALKIRWRGDADRLIQCLVDTRWLDESSDPAIRLIVHDWHDHCPNWVRGFLSKKGLAFASGVPSSSKSKKAAPSSPLNHTHTLLPAETPSQTRSQTPSQTGSQAGASTEDILGPPSGDLPPGMEPHGLPSGRTESPETNVAMSEAVWDALFAYIGNPARVGGKLRSNIERYIGQYGEPIVIEVLAEAKLRRKHWGDLGFMLNERKQKEYDRGKPSGSDIDAAAARRTAQREREFPEDDRPLPKLSC